ncbi:DUF6531 domain-containing protein, partial [Vibrio metschnikovii]|uniref:DUF6531 domain-containing protein n=1 Tax=Vibrio metschnikovii TaxID=28172 RepID=UPI002FC5D9EA
MSQERKAQLLSSAEAAEQNFSTDNVLDGGCVECGCEIFIRYHYDDDKPVPNAPFVLIDSNKKELTGQTDDQGLTQIKNVGCGSFEVLLDEGSDDFKPKDKLTNNPALQDNPHYAAIAGEYFALYTLLNRQGYLTYDASDSDDNNVNVGHTGWLGGTFTRIPKEYKPAYDRFWQLYKNINRGSIELRQAVNQIHCGLAGELAGRSQDNTAILLFCQIALGFVPVVGQAMDIYDLGDWGWTTCVSEELDEWHWANGALIGIGFIPGLGDAMKKTGNAVLEGLRKSDSRSIQSSIKILRSLSNGNLVKYLMALGNHLKDLGQKAKVLIQQLIDGLTRVLRDSSKYSNWVVRLLKDAFTGLINAMQKLADSMDRAIAWIIQKVDEFIGRVMTRKTGTAKPKGTAKSPENSNLGKQDPNKVRSDEEALQAQGSSSSSTNHCREKGEPVDMLTGKIFESREDVFLAARLPVLHERYYHSTGQRETGLLGTLWRSSWDICLKVEGNRVTFIDKDYTTAHFTSPYLGLPTQSALKPEWRLHRGEQGELILKHKQGMEYHFNHALGNTLRLTKQQDAYGNATEFLYEQRVLKWLVLCDGRLIQVETHRQRIQSLRLCHADKKPIRTLVKYHYDIHGHLLSVRGDAGRNFDYQYSAEGYLLRWQDLAQTWVEHDYDQQGRSVATRCSGGYWQDQVRYDDEQRIHYYKNAFGGISAYHLDEHHRPLMTVDEFGHQTTSVWCDDHLISETNALGEKVEYAYDEWGNVTHAIEPNGSEHHYKYNEQGWLLSYTNPMGAVWSYEYNPFGDVTVMTDPEGRQTRWTYTEWGQRASVTGPDGSITKFSYHDTGLLARIEPAVGYGINLFYDSQSRLIKRVTDNKQTREWFYDKQQKQPARVRYEDGSQAYFDYDIEGNLVKVTDALGHSQHFSYGPFDKLTQVTDPLGAVTHYHYNAEAEFAGVTNRHGQKWYYDFDEGGRISAEHHYDARVEQYQYDAANRLTVHSKPDGVQHRYRYDPSGKLLETVTFDHNEQQLGKAWYEYDAASRLTYAENGDAWVSFAYSPSGLLLEENLNGTPLVHEYDEHGRRIGSSGSKTARQYHWTKHQLQQLSVGEHTPLQFAYHPSGHEQTRATEQGFSLHHQWSETGLLLEQQLGANKASLRQYHYDALDRLVGIDDAKRGQSRFSLNANGQVQTVRQQKTWDSQHRFVHLFGYDSELNLNQ